VFEENGIAYADTIYVFTPDEVASAVFEGCAYIVA
jgi:hypothetical protein